jgi:hypothetical protein
MNWFKYLEYIPMERSQSVYSPSNTSEMGIGIRMGIVGDEGGCPPPPISVLVNLRVRARPCQSTVNFAESVPWTNTVGGWKSAEGDGGSSVSLYRGSIENEANYLYGNHFPGKQSPGGLTPLAGVEWGPVGNPTKHVIHLRISSGANYSKRFLNE